MERREVAMPTKLALAFPLLLSFPVKQSSSLSPRHCRSKPAAVVDGLASCPERVSMPSSRHSFLSSSPGRIGKVLHEFDSSPVQRKRIVGEEDPFIEKESPGLERDFVLCCSSPGTDPCRRTNGREEAPKVRTHVTWRLIRTRK